MSFLTLIKLVNRAAMLRAWLRSFAANSSAATTCQQVSCPSALARTFSACTALTGSTDWNAMATMIGTPLHLHMVWEAGEVVHAALVQGAGPHTPRSLQLLLAKRCIYLGHRADLACDQSLQGADLGCRQPLLGQAGPAAGIVHSNNSIVITLSRESALIPPTYLQDAVGGGAHAPIWPLLVLEQAAEVRGCMQRSEEGSAACLLQCRSLSRS
jgi:hypothetical protein